MEKSVREEINGELDIFGFSKNKNVVDHLVDLIESGRVKGVRPNEVAEEFIAFACTLSGESLENNLKQFDEIFFKKHKKIEVQSVKVSTPSGRGGVRPSALSTPKMTPISVRRKNMDSSMDDELSKLYGVSATPTNRSSVNVFDMENVENLPNLSELIEAQADETNITTHVITAKTFLFDCDQINEGINNFVDYGGVWVEKSEKKFVVDTNDFAMNEIFSKRIDTISRLICESNGLPTNFHSPQTKTDSDVFFRGVFSKFVGLGKNEKDVFWYFQVDENANSKRVLVNFEKCEPPFYFFPGMIAVIKGSIDDNFVLNAKKVFFNKKMHKTYPKINPQHNIDTSFGVFCGPLLNTIIKNENNRIDFYSVETNIDALFSKIIGTLNTISVKTFFLLGPVIQVDISFADKILVTKMVMKRLSQFCAESQVKCFYIANEDDIFCAGNCFPAVNFYHKFYCDVADEYSPNLIVLKNPEKILLDRTLPVSFISTDVLLHMNSQKVAVEQTKNRINAILENLLEQNSLYPLLSSTTKRVDPHLTTIEANLLYDKLPPPKIVFFNSVLQHFVSEIHFDPTKILAVNPGRLLKKTGAIVSINQKIEAKIIKL